MEEHQSSVDVKDEEDRDGKLSLRKGDFVAIAPDGDEPFWLALLMADVDSIHDGRKNVPIMWVDPDNGDDEEGTRRRKRGIRKRRRIQEISYDNFHMGASDKVTRSIPAPRCALASTKPLLLLLQIPVESIMCKIELTPLDKNHFSLSKRVSNPHTY